MARQAATPVATAPPQPPPDGAQPVTGTEMAAPGAFAPQPMGFYTDTTVCIGCKACEVACKNWNGLSSTGGADTPGAAAGWAGDGASGGFRRVCCSMRSSPALMGLRVR